VWKRADGPQIRLLLPDLAEDPGAADAMLRSTDLDCDAHAADSRDCDDLRIAYHDGQTETCDGQDTDCDGRRLELVEGCNATGDVTCSATGVSLCAEGPTDAPAVAGVCLQTAECACSPNGGGTGQSCASCTLGWTTTSGGATLCAPAAGKLHFDPCAAPGCTIDVVDVTGPWEIRIAPEEAGPYSVRLTGIATDYFYLRAKYLGTTVPAIATSLGEAYIGVTDPLQIRPKLLPINLGRSETARTQCTPGTSGNNPMLCLP
jgi:hypothetical protein